jgi:hypothetical protein
VEGNGARDTAFRGDREVDLCVRNRVILGLRDPPPLPPLTIATMLGGSDHLKKLLKIVKQCVIWGNQYLVHRSSLPMTLTLVSLFRGCLF